VTLVRTLGPWGQSLAEQVAVARAAEEAGFACAWVPELHRSAFVPATAIAAATTRLDVGTGIAWAFARSELVTALHALDLDELSDGRFRWASAPVSSG
jgi:alkanesulfonate monooxygenase SsuD/methylene tetrahydromethanopterin reductase-like flavin-dependent oxidoreductase (luciferase family)